MARLVNISKVHYIATLSSISKRSTLTIPNMPIISSILPLGIFPVPNPGSPQCHDRVSSSLANFSSDAATYFGPPKAKKKTETLWSHSGSSPQECTTSAAAAVCTRELPSSIPTASSYHCAAHTLIGKACCCTHTFDAARSGGKLQKTE